MKARSYLAGGLLFFCVYPLVADSDPLPISGKAGISAERVATEDLEYYPFGAYVKLDYDGLDTFTPYTRLKYTGNRRIFDGLGNLETIGVLDTYLGSEWDPNDNFSFDGFYRFGFGTNSYIAHEGSLGSTFTGISLADFSVSANYVNASYIYPGTTTSLTMETISPDADISFHLTDSLLLPVGVEYTRIQYSTSDPYTVWTGHIGFDWDITEKFNVTSNIQGGRDSSNYTLWGFDADISYKFWKATTLTLSIDYIQYVDPITLRGGKGKKSLSSGNTGGANNPLGSSDTFSYFTLGAEVSYAF